MSPIWFLPITKKIKCPDGTIRIIYRNVNDAFPLYVPGCQTSFGASIKGIQDINANIGAEYLSKIQGLLFNLDELNHNIMISFRAAYIAFQSNPCHNADIFQNKIGLIIEEHSKLTSIRMKINGLIQLLQSNPDNSVEILHIYQNIIEQLEQSNLINAVSTEIAEARNIVSKWIGVQK